MKEMLKILSTPSFRNSLLGDAASGDIGIDNASTAVSKGLTVKKELKNQRKSGDTSYIFWGDDTSGYRIEYNEENEN